MISNSVVQDIENINFPGNTDRYIMLIFLNQIGLSFCSVIFSTLNTVKKKKHAKNAIGLNLVGYIPSIFEISD